MMWLILIGVLCVIIYYKTIRSISYWKDRGVPYKTSYPIVGSFATILFQRKAFFDYVCEMYQEFSKERYYGVYQFNLPGLYIKDLELIKKIGVKDFDQFTDHNSFTAFELDPVMTRNLFNLKGQRWRDMRSTLSPSFTGSKMKVMFSLVSDCGETLANYFLKQSEGVQEVEMKDVFTRFTNDAIASAAFGFKCNSLEDKNNEFYVMAKRATDISGSSFIAFIMQVLFPSLARFLKIPVIPVTVSTFFRRIIKDTVHQREKDGLVRRDMIHLLMEARKGREVHEEEHLPDTGFATVKELNVTRSDKKQKLEISDEDIAAQAFIFIFGGFDTSSSLASFIGYELAMNSDIQVKLQEEIDNTLNECDGKLTYEALHKMKYMDMVVSETLRKWPPGFQSDRVCVKDYLIEPENPWEKALLIEKGTMVLFPVVAIHRDPQYFPNPDVFDPERFNDENKNQIKPYSYLPFGIGPRSCIASRFALMQNKILFFHLLSKFDIVRTEKTPFPLKVAKSSVTFTAEGGFWIGFKRRALK
ncbi:hypothetical protein FQR65_LT01844 [Abscondita terminalis]|nr:hypothetical protein FQR65_LT01844 [Abscondita terminalis]